MIYLSKNNQSEIVTDNVTDSSPETVDVYLDDVLIGNFENLSTRVKYIEFLCPKLDMQEKEYTMKIYSYDVLLKQELVIVKDLSKFTPKSVTNPKTIKMYEK